MLLENRITFNERICIEGLFMGYSVERIAADSKLSTRTIQFYMRNVLRKLGCDAKKLKTTVLQ